MRLKNTIQVLLMGSASMLSSALPATTLVVNMTYAGEIANGNCEVEHQTLDFGNVSAANLVAGRVSKDLGIAIRCDGLSFPSAISFSSATPGDDFGTEKYPGLVVKLQTGTLGLQSYDKQRVTNGSILSLDALGASSTYIFPLHVTLASATSPSNGVFLGVFDIPVTVNFTY